MARRISVAEWPDGLSELHPDGWPIPGQFDLPRLLGVAKTEAHRVLLVERHHRCLRQRVLHGRRVADRGDDIRRAVGTPVEQQRVADTAWRRGRDEPLVLHLD